MITVYTVIVNDYDNLRMHGPASGDTRFICFTDRPRHVHGWEMQAFPQVLSDNKNSRIPKCLPHLLLDSEFSIYVDGAFRVDRDPIFAMQMLGSADLALFRHPGGHTSIHDERNFYQTLHGYVPDDVEAQYQTYVAGGLPTTGEFWAGGFVVRRHTAAIERFNELWFREYLAGSANDQFALYAAVVKSGVKVATIDGVVTLDRRFPYMLHANTGCADNPQYEKENELWASRRRRLADLIQ